jgi:hypothetical protein
LPRSRLATPKALSYLFFRWKAIRYNKCGLWCSIARSFPGHGDFLCVN